MESPLHRVTVALRYVLCRRAACGPIAVHSCLYCSYDGVTLLWLHRLCKQHAFAIVVSVHHILKITLLVVALP
jgi:hypothetical protein